jgi:hypothetical protein
MKNIKKSILLATALFVTTGSFANDDYRDNKGHNERKEYKHNKYEQERKNNNKHHGYNNNDKKERRSHRGDVSRFFIGAVYDLKLTKEQETKIDTTIREFKNKKFDRFNGFTKDGFNKNAYINARTKTKEDKIKLQADLIEKIYTTLDKTQIEQLSKQIEMFKNKREKR